MIGCFDLHLKGLAELETLSVPFTVRAILGGPTEARKEFEFRFADFDGRIPFSSFVHSIYKLERAKSLFGCVVFIRVRCFYGRVFVSLENIGRKHLRDQEKEVKIRPAEVRSDLLFGCAMFYLFLL